MIVRMADCYVRLAASAYSIANASEHGRSSLRGGGWLSSNIDIHCGNVFAGKGIRGVGDEQACLVSRVSVM